MTKSMLPLCALLLAGSIGIGDAPQDLGEKVQALEKQLAEAQLRDAEQTKRLEALETAQARTEAWFRGLPPALEALHGKMAQARKDGFEKAGPNPRSKKAVLDGIQAFSRALAPVLPTPEPKPERRR